MTTRKIHQKIIIMMLVITLVLSFSACDSDKTVKPDNTKKIIDCMGREVMIPENPQNVAVFYASTAHMMAMLDEGEKIVAAPRGVKTDELMLMKYPKIAETATPYQENSINTEELLNIDVDLALIRVSTAVNEGETEKLDKLGIPYLVVDYGNINELKNALTVIGKTFGKEEKASDYIKYMEETIKTVSISLKEVNKSDYPQIFHSVNEAIRTDTDGDICMEIMDLAGTINAASAKNIKSDGNKNYTTLEEIYKWDPYAIIANEYSVTEYILSDSKWGGLDSVKNKRVYTLPVGATRWCHPGSMEPHMGVLAIAKRFYPDEMSDIDLKQTTKDYYKKYFNIELGDEIINKILSGKGMRMSNTPVQ